MISHWDPRWFLLVGFCLLLLGFILPVLMIMQIVPSTFFLNFFSYGASLVGLVLGFYGAISLAARNRKK